jgi:hypothetical protein
MKGKETKYKVVEIGFMNEWERLWRRTRGHVHLVSLLQEGGFIWLFHPGCHGFG